MKVICIDDRPGFQSGEKPPFQIGDTLNAKQSPYHPLDYLILPDKSRGWHKNRFIKAPRNVKKENKFDNSENKPNFVYEQR